MLSLHPPKYDNFFLALKITWTARSTKTIHAYQVPSTICIFLSKWIDPRLFGGESMIIMARSTSDIASTLKYVRFTWPQEVMSVDTILVLLRTGNGCFCSRREIRITCISLEISSLKQNSQQLLTYTYICEFSLSKAQYYNKRTSNFCPNKSAIKRQTYSLETRG